jgi:hypothetical protein
MFAVRKSRFPKEATNPIASNSCFAIDGIVDTVSGLGRKQATTSPSNPAIVAPRANGSVEQPDRHRFGPITALRDPRAQARLRSRNTDAIR